MLMQEEPLEKPLRILLVERSYESENGPRRTPLYNRAEKT
jgi:hypothetical protein